MSYIDNICIIISVISGITNGVLFFPGSQYIYYILYIEDGYVGVCAILFSLSNSVGHYILFKLSRRYIPKITEIELYGILKIINIVMKDSLKFSDYIYQNIDKNYWSVAILRGFPFFHSAVSIMASRTSIGDLEFILKTFLGNIIYMLSIHSVLYYIGAYREYSMIYTPLSIAAIFLLSVFIKRVIFWILQKNL